MGRNEILIVGFISEVLQEVFLKNRMQVDFWFDVPDPDDENARIAIPPGTCIRFLPPNLSSDTDPTFGPSAAPISEIPGENPGDPAVEFPDDDPSEIRYAVTWPDEVPILKVGPNC